MASAAPPAVLPAPLDRWVDGLLGGPPPTERHASCSRCAMCAHPGDDPPPPRRITFDRQVRCCTYRPALANHVAGRLWHDPTLREQVERRLAAGEGTPFGLRVAPPYQLLYRHASAAAFGRATSLRCPHQRGDGGCAIWATRPAVCATWYCKHERGAVGARLWTRLRDCLSAAERLLALWCLDQLGWSGAQRRDAIAAYDLDRFEPAAIDGNAEPEHARRLWGTWAGREFELYQRCAELVAPLDWAAVERIGGAELASLAAAARDAAREHDDLTPPSALAAGRFAVVGAHQGRLCLQSYSEFDPLEVSSDVLALVARCDGRTPEAIVAEHVAAGGRLPTRRLLRTLVDFDVIEAAGTDRAGDGLPRR